MFEAVDFTGEIGGLLALAFAMGAGAGWGFAQRTAVKLANARISELKDELAQERKDRKQSDKETNERLQSLQDTLYRDARGNKPETG